MKDTPINTEIINLLFPKVTSSVADFRIKYPARNLPPGAFVTRIAPSPTGSMHLGAVYMSLICKKLARQTQGVFFLRIEDTDKKREVPGAVQVIINGLDYFGLSPDEGPTRSGDEKGAYGPYTQSARFDIYQAFVKELMEKGFAYPCFATEQDLTNARAEQEAQQIKPGYYGKWALWRDADLEKIKQNLALGLPYTIRFKAPVVEGSDTFKHGDLLRGEIELPKNDQDFVLLKSDGMPTYHLAHAADDYLMGTTHVIRSDEWVSSLPIHYALFRAFGFPVPRYGHVAPIQKMTDVGGKRKLSKRHDPEASVEYYESKGYPAGSIIEYLMNLANPNFEDWRKQNPAGNLDGFVLAYAKFNKSGPLFDEIKLKDIAKTVIAKMTAVEVYNAVLTWAHVHNTQFEGLLIRHKEYALDIFGIERGDANARKDISTWSEVPGECAYFFGELFETPKSADLVTTLKKDEIISILDKVAASHNPGDDRDVWFQKMKTLAGDYGLASSLKIYKENPTGFKGHVGELTQVVRFAITGRPKTPDLYSVIKVIGRDEYIKRLNAFAKAL